MADADTKARPNALYETDFFAWTQEQARLLRERRWSDLDVDNLIDEVESVGSSEKRAIRNRLKRLLTDLLKWKVQPGHGGNSWRRSIREQRESIAHIIQASPGLGSYVSHATATAYTGATVAASEETGSAIGVFPDQCPFSEADILNLEFLPEDRSFE